jgi:hypothetical protein
MSKFYASVNFDGACAPMPTTRATSSTRQNSFSHKFRPDAAEAPCVVHDNLTGTDEQPFPDFEERRELWSGLAPWQTIDAARDAPHMDLFATNMDPCTLTDSQPTMTSCPLQQGLFRRWHHQRLTRHAAPIRCRVYRTNTPDCFALIGKASLLCHFEVVQLRITDNLKANGVPTCIKQ